QVCNNETAILGVDANLVPGDINDPRVLCGPEFRGLTAGCQAATCDADEQELIDQLTSQVCGPFYEANATESAVVSAAVASNTAIAIAATEGKDPTDLAVFPECALPCIQQNNYNGCGGNIALCVCQDVGFNAAVGECQVESCDTEGLLSTLFIAEKLCEPFGGILTNPINYTALVANGTVSGNGTTNTTIVSPEPVPFEGQGTLSHGSVGVMLGMTGVAVVVGLMML
ncbi:MAG: hypothetical protein Q9169_008597, partial [Polycauliona sp. 2 TL-2023]